MRTLVCVPIFVEDQSGSSVNTIDAALADAALAKRKGADLVEFRIDRFFSGSESPGGSPRRADSGLGFEIGSEPDPEPGSASRATDDAFAIAQLRRLLAESPLPVVLTCRPTWEGGEYDGDDADRVALFERLCCGCEHPPAYLDVELAAYTRSANIRQKINLCVTHPGQQRDVSTRLILSVHDFQTRPPDLDRKILAAVDEPACSVVKVAYRARSLRDNLDLFEILRTTPKPTIALGMGEFGLMSRVLAPKFGGFLTFASLRDESATAPGQPTIDDLLGMYRFRKIGKETKLYGVIGWPVGHSLSPLIHNAGFEAVGWDGVYLPLPVAADEKDVEASYTSFKATLEAFDSASGLALEGVSVTLPHKENAAQYMTDVVDGLASPVTIGAANTLNRYVVDDPPDRYELWQGANTDAMAIHSLLRRAMNGLAGKEVAIVGAGGVARAATYAAAFGGGHAVIYGRTPERAEAIVEDLITSDQWRGRSDSGGEGSVRAVAFAGLRGGNHDAYINCTPVGMTGGPAPDALSIPIPDMPNIDESTVFFDTVYNPVETPMLRAARERGCRTIDGVEMFVRQAAAQFELWTGMPAPVELFDRLCREKLAGA
ncbi:MAG: type I 3-dehydroquinate dehydratase [Phycisphaeraceae bacterium]|nr:MAG: type I 3-dehydroquinate dehydratase [Phycisphaeraceae bacterium]